MKVLVAGWFSFEGMGATAGDLMTRDLACDWLRACQREFDVAVAPPFLGGVDWDTVDPADYSHVIFVCGPFGNGPPVTEFLARFAGRHLTGLNLTMLDPVEAWNPFDLLLERDSSRTGRPDLSFLSRQSHVPVVGVILIHPQREYGARGLHEEANGAIRAFVAASECATVDIDTRLDVNGTGLRTAREVESLIARMDVVLTTRLHGLVLSLKNGVPVVAIDPVAGGAKISRQARACGWPALLAAEDANDTTLRAAFAYCLTADARTRADEVRRGAQHALREVRDCFVAVFGPSDSGSVA